MLTLVYNPDSITYPDSTDCFSPSLTYPEYPFKDTIMAGKQNSIYENVRELFAVSGYDSKHYGSGEWNPLGDDIISPGNTVLIKPNWVDNKNKTNPDDLSCLVTNPAVVRAVIDYVIIALKGTGKIIIADAPMQSCDLQDLLEKTGYNRLFDFYRNAGVNIQIFDLRKYSVGGKYKGVTGEIQYNDNEGAITINLGSRSLHTIHDRDSVEYRVEDYSKAEMSFYHSNGKHRYSISKTILNADVIINIPKPKTHRLAGMTGAVKNFVGTTFDKASLPHRMEGDKESGKGDAYYKRSIWKRWMSVFGDKKTVKAKEGHFLHAKFYDFLMKTNYVIGAATSRDQYRIGSWYGNDTIWRTAVDLNNIVMHVDNDGIYHEKQIRKILSIGDMIIAGQGEGPVGPSPKPLGILLLSDNAMLFDFLLCHMMGFSDEKLPMFNNEETLKIFGFATKNAMKLQQVHSNHNSYHGCLKELHFPDEWAFEPHSCWKGHIENTDK